VKKKIGIKKINLFITLAVKGSSRGVNKDLKK
jgi:hypothetical protein